MVVHKHTFASGLRLLTIPMPSMTSATVTVWVGVGSRYEDDATSGISHFLEHMVFKGAKKYKTAKEISESIDSIGAEFNAGTSKDYTNFYIRSQVGFMDKTFDILSDMVLSPNLTDQDISRERGVILSEMDMYEDTPIYRISDVFDQLYFEGSTLGRDIIGVKDTVGKGIKRNDFIDFRKKHYNANNIVISVAGGITERQSIALTEKYFGKISESKTTPSFEVFKNSQVGPRIKLVSKDIEQAHIVVGFPGIKVEDDHKYIESVLTTILGGGMSSRLFTEVREKRGLCYSIRTSSDHYIDCGNLTTYTGTDPKKAYEAIQVILDETYNLSNMKNRLTKEELQKAKDYDKGHIALSLESTKAVGSFFGYEELLTGKLTSIEEEFKGIDNVQEEEVYSFAKSLFDPKKINLAIIGPFKDIAPFEKILN